jgi:hypothetical protein
LARQRNMPAGHGRESVAASFCAQPCGTRLHDLPCTRPPSSPLKQTSVSQRRIPYHCLPTVLLVEESFQGNLNMALPCYRLSGCQFQFCMFSQPHWRTQPSMLETHLSPRGAYPVSQPYLLWYPKYRAASARPWRNSHLNCGMLTPFPCVSQGHTNER